MMKQDKLLDGLNYFTVAVYKSYQSHNYDEYRYSHLGICTGQQQSGNIRNFFIMKQEKLEIPSFENVKILGRGYL